MAIYKEIVKENGVRANYHRISSIAINHDLNSCIIKIDSYKDEKLRDLDKIKQDVLTSINNLTRLSCETTSQELIKVFNSKIETIRTNNFNILQENYVTYSDDYTIDYIPENVSKEGFYNEVKKIDVFSDSKDV